MSFEDDEYRTASYRVSGGARATGGPYNRRNTLTPSRRAPGWQIPGPATADVPGDGFDTVRPDWLSSPDFVPVDTSRPDPAGPDLAIIDYTRPELWMNSEGEYPSDGQVGLHQGDDIDEPYDHRRNPCPRT
jgi:hypothetical protein